MKAALKKANMPDTPTARLILGKILAENADVEAEKKVALAEAYRCGYEAGAVAEREECAKVCETHAAANTSWTKAAVKDCAAAIRARTTT